MNDPNPSRSDVLKLGGALAASTVFGKVAAGQTGGLIDKDITADEVRAAIEQGANFLKRQQLNDGSWPDRTHYAGGLSALCTLALLHAGCALDDDVMRQALGYLRMLQAKTTYALSLQTMALCMAEPDADRLLIQRNVRSLES